MADDWDYGFANPVPRGFMVNLLDPAVWAKPDTRFEGRDNGRLLWESDIGGGKGHLPDYRPYVHPSRGCVMMA